MSRCDRIFKRTKKFHVGSKKRLLRKLKRSTQQAKPAQKQPESNISLETNTV